jgi:hypothetical protein
MNSKIKNKMFENISALSNDIKNNIDKIFVVPEEIPDIDYRRMAVQGTL